jgi:hypothetical protein
MRTISGLYNSPGNSIVFRLMSIVSSLGKRNSVGPERFVALPAMRRLQKFIGSPIIISLRMNSASPVPSIVYQTPSSIHSSN